MKKHHTLLCIASVLTGTLTADTIELKSGVKYQGKVISEDEKSYLVEIRHTASIKDERRIAKDLVRNIISDAKDSDDYKKVKACYPTPDMLSQKGYDKRIKLAADFLKKYPKSTHTKEVKTIFTELKKENQVVSQGGMKLGGQLILASDIEVNSYDIHARIIGKDILKLAKSGNYQLSLRKWEELQSDYPHSETYKESIPLVLRVLRAYQGELQKHLDTLEARIDKRKTVIESLEANDQKRTLKLLDDKKKRYSSIIEKEKSELQTKWLTIDPFHKEALDHNLRNAQSSQQQLSNINTADIKLAGSDFRGAWSALANGDLEDVAVHLQALSSMQLPEKYTTPLKQKLEEQKAAQLAKKEAEEEAAAAAKAAEEKAAKEAKEKAAQEKKGRGKKSRS